jgi:hypothetical protein
LHLSVTAGMSSHHDVRRRGGRAGAEHDAGF